MPIPVGKYSENNEEEKARQKKKGLASNIYIMRFKRIADSKELKIVALTTVVV
jgi:hypothetical protein